MEQKDSMCLSLSGKQKGLFLLRGFVNMKPAAEERDFFFQVGNGCQTNFCCVQCTEAPSANVHRDIGQGPTQSAGLNDGVF